MYITVRIPAEEKARAPYKMYAYGALQTKWLEGDCHRLVFDAAAALVVFYYFPSYRKAYILLPQKCAGTSRHLPNISRPRVIAASFRSRAFDRLKNTVRHLDAAHGKSAWYYGEYFWRCLALLVERGKCAAPLIDHLAKGVSEQVQYRLTNNYLYDRIKP